MTTGQLIGILFLAGLLIVGAVEKAEHKKEIKQAIAMQDSMLAQASRNSRTDTVLVNKNNTQTKEKKADTLVNQQQYEPPTQAEIEREKEIGAQMPSITDSVIERLQKEAENRVRYGKNYDRVSDDDEDQQTIKKPALKKAPRDTLFDNIDLVVGTIKIGAMAQNLTVDVQLPFPAGSYEPYDILIRHVSGYVNNAEFIGFCTQYIADITRKSKWKSQDLYIDVGGTMWRISTADCRSAWSISSQESRGYFLIQHIVDVHK